MTLRRLGVDSVSGSPSRSTAAASWGTTRRGSAGWRCSARREVSPVAQAVGSVALPAEGKDAVPVGQRDERLRLPDGLLAKSYRLPEADRTLCLRIRMPHGHGAAGENPEEIHVFANQILTGDTRWPGSRSRGKRMPTCGANSNPRSRSPKRSSASLATAGSGKTASGNRPRPQVDAAGERASASSRPPPRSPTSTSSTIATASVSTEHSRAQAGGPGQTGLTPRDWALVGCVRWMVVGGAAVPYDG